MISRKDVEIDHPAWYAIPLVRQICRICGCRSWWCDDRAGLIFWEIFHECKGKA